MIAHRKFYSAHAAKHSSNASSYFHGEFKRLSQSADCRRDGGKPLIASNLMSFFAPAVSRLWLSSNWISLMVAPEHLESGGIQRYRFPAIRRSPFI
jgi:hypothetical protein